MTFEKFLQLKLTKGERITVSFQSRDYAPLSGQFASVDLGQKDDDDNWVLHLDGGGYCTLEIVDKIERVKKIPVETWKVLDESTFSAFVTEVYGRPYQYQQQEKFGENPANETIEYVTADPAYVLDMHELDDGFVRKEDVDKWTDCNPAGLEPQQGPVSLEMWLSREVGDIPEPTSWHQEYTPGSFYSNLWWTRRFFPHVEEVLADLCRRGHLEPGDYVMHFYW